MGANERGVNRGNHSDFGMFVTKDQFKALYCARVKEDYRYIDERDNPCDVFLPYLAGIS
ncbi:MAG: hypothetical protein ACREOZ_00175 [Gloeomargaritales cyanobacterium]